MEKILIIGCKRVMDDVCIGCSRCLVGFNRREGEFSRYQGMNAEVIGLLSCGDCPGAGIVPRLAQFNLWNTNLKEKPTKVHIAVCLKDHCPYVETIVQKIKAKAGVEVVLGSHPYIPENVFT
ncbi:MAG: CGGC domain-containing protein [bacterium]